MTDKHQNNSNTIDYLNSQIVGLESRQGIEENVKRRIIQEHRDSLPPIERADRDLGEYDDPAKRIIGHVIYAPRFGTGTTNTNGPRLRDWALIELHAEKFTTPLSKLDNQVFTGDAQRARSQVVNARQAEGFTKRIKMIFSFSSHTVWVEGTLPRNRDDKTL